MRQTKSKHKGCFSVFCLNLWVSLPGIPQRSSTEGPGGSGQHLCNTLTPDNANKPNNKWRREGKKPEAGREESVLLPIPPWETPAQQPSIAACHPPPPQRPVPTIHQTHLFAKFLSPHTPQNTWGRPTGLGHWFLGLTCGRGGSPTAATAHPPSPSPARSRRASAARPLVPAAFYIPPGDCICCICWREGGVRGGVRGTIPGTEQKMSKRRAFAGSDSAADGGISISRRTAASKVFQAMLLIAFAALELEWGEDWMESPSPGTSRHRRRWIWHGLFITGTPDRSIRHSLGSGVGGLSALMGAEDLGLSFCGIKGDLVKSKALGTAAASHPGQGERRQRGSLPDVPGSPPATSFGCKSSGRETSSLGVAFPEHGHVYVLGQAHCSPSAPIKPQPLHSTRAGPALGCGHLPYCAAA